MRARPVLFVFVVTLVAVSVGNATVAGAASLRIAPLKYDVALKAGETKKGFVDIANTSTVAETVELSVQAFRQTDNNGSLTFYDDAKIKAGVLLDYSEVEIGPKEVLHLAFAVESAKLPAGNVFATIFASTKPDVGSGTAQSVRVGTLMFIANGSTGEHHAAVEQLRVAAFQFSDNLSAAFALRNTGDPKTTSGFFPEITVRLFPYAQETVKGPLVFPGVTRQIDYTKQGSYFGLIKYIVKTPDSVAIAYSFAITGYWRVVVPGVLVLLTGGVITLVRIRRRHAR